MTIFDIIALMPPTDFIGPGAVLIAAGIIAWARTAASNERIHDALWMTCGLAVFFGLLLLLVGAYAWLVEPIDPGQFGVEI